MFCCERHGKQLVFIMNYDIKILLSLPNWLFLVHEIDFLCFKYSCYTHILFYCEKFSNEKITKLQSLSKCMGRYFKEDVLTLVVY